MHIYSYHHDLRLQAAWADYHAFIDDALAKVEALHGNDGDGVNGISIDLHGYEGTDWRDNGGNHWVQ